MKKRKNSDKIIYAVVLSLLVIGLIFVWKQTKFNFAYSFISGIQKKISSFLSYAGDTFGSFRYITLAKNGIKVLSEKNMVLESEMQTLKAENEKLKRLVVLRSYRDFRQSIICQASVIGSNDDGFIYFYTLDRGADDGISEGDGVITPEGIIGRIYKVSQSTSMVQLITDVKSSVSTRNDRSRVTGILSGISYNRCVINYIPKEEDVKEGDVIITSGLGKTFPEGIKIGVVIVANKKVDGLSMAVTVKPYANLMTVEEVFVLRKR